MQPCDYSRSFVTFSVPGNKARIQVEARCLLTQADGSSEEFLMFASCKSEDTYAERDLFKTPNYDFSGIYGDTRFCISRIHASSDVEQLEAGLTAERFTGLRKHVAEAPATALLTKRDVIEATLDHRVIIARNEITDAASGVTQLIEYPVKTMNVNPETGEFQTDTGPVPLYDFGEGAAEIMARFRWAYVAFNDFSKAWFVLQTPTAVRRDGAEVGRTTHYSQTAHFAQSRNTLFALGN